MLLASLIKAFVELLKHFGAKPMLFILALAFREDVPMTVFVVDAAGAGGTRSPCYRFRIIFYRRIIVLVSFTIGVSSFQCHLLSAFHSQLTFSSIQ